MSLLAALIGAQLRREEIYKLPKQSNSVQRSESINIYVVSSLSLPYLFSNIAKDTVLQRIVLKILQAI